MSTGEQLAAVLFEVLIDNASDEQVQKIAQVLHTLKETYHRSYKGVMKQPFANHLVTAMEEAVQYRNEVGDA